MADHKGSMGAHRRYLGPPADVTIGTVQRIKQEMAATV
jgi:hypothetical protein